MDSLWEWNPSQMFIYKVEVNIYIGFLALKVRCTQYGFCGQGNLRECKGNFFFYQNGWDMG